VAGKYFPGEKNLFRRGLSRINCSLKEVGSEPFAREVRRVRSQEVGPQCVGIELPVTETQLLKNLKIPLTFNNFISNNTAG